jgi:inner centromere protein
MKKMLLKAKIAEKLEKEETRKKELEQKKEQERLERIRKRQERMKKVAENKALLKEANEMKKKKVEANKNEQKTLAVHIVKDDKAEKMKQRHLAAEKRRKEKEDEKRKQLQEIENDRLLQEELQRKRNEIKEEERKKKFNMKAKLGPKPTEPATNTELTENLSSDTQGCPLPISSNIPSTIQQGGVVTEITPLKHVDAVTSYEVTPASADPLNVADSYDIAGLHSSDSSDDEDCPKKVVPMWAAPTNLNKLLAEQEYRVSHDRNFNVENIFPPDQLLITPQLERIFRIRSKRFNKRTSSAQWSSPILKKPRPSSQ